MEAWAVSADGRQFTTEMQNDTSSDDASALLPGSYGCPGTEVGEKTKYKHLPETVIIFITQEDIFEKDLAKYAFT